LGGSISTYLSLSRLNSYRSYIRRIPVGGDWWILREWKFGLNLCNAIVFGLFWHVGVVGVYCHISHL
jgi:hypothetical protein